jgi:2-octaprenyl-6-methoxyphenol hydroxylase
VVFTMPPEKAGQLMQFDEQAFLAALRIQFGSRIDFVASGPRAVSRSRCASARDSPSRVRCGSAMLRKACTQFPARVSTSACATPGNWLKPCSHAPCGDAGDAAGRTFYAQGRRGDRRGSMAFTDGIVRVFSNDLGPLRVARGLGLLSLDLLPPLRHFVARRMIWGARAWP